MGGSRKGRERVEKKIDLFSFFSCHLFLILNLSKSQRLKGNVTCRLFIREILGSFSGVAGAIHVKKHMMTHEISMNFISLTFFPGKLVAYIIG